MKKIISYISFVLIIILFNSCGSSGVNGELTGSKVFPAKFSNTCWSLVDTNDGVKVGATYKATDEKIAKVDGFISKTGETADVRKATYEESLGWYAGITADMFGLVFNPSSLIRAGIFSLNLKKPCVAFGHAI